MRYFLVVAAFLVIAFGCSIKSRPTEAQCLSMAKERRFYGTVAASTGFAAGTSGLATNNTQDDRERAGIAVAGCITGSIAAGAAYLSETLADDIETHCTKDETKPATREMIYPQWTTTPR
jgi:hypothetical protein